jgi:hypothetical protein
VAEPLHEYSVELGWQLETVLGEQLPPLSTPALAQQ